MAHSHEQDNEAADTNDQVTARSTEMKGCLTIYEGTLGTTEAYIRLEKTETPNEWTENRQ